VPDKTVKSEDARLVQSIGSQERRMCFQIKNIVEMVNPPNILIFSMLEPYQTSIRKGQELPPPIPKDIEGDLK